MLTTTKHLLEREIRNWYNYCRAFPSLKRKQCCFLGAKTELICKHAVFLLLSDRFVVVSCRCVLIFSPVILYVQIIYYFAAEK